MLEGLVRSLGTGRFLDWGALDAYGPAGGLLICWDKRILEVLEMGVGNFSISCRLRNVEELVWIFTSVYGPFSREDRDCMWEELGAIRGIWDDPWCLGGDFNVILSQRERSSQGRLIGAMTRNNQAWARLDRFLVTQNWLDHFSGVVQSRLPRPTSDHFPILLMGGGLRRGPSPFRFENMWLKVDGFKDLLRGWWQGSEVRGRASFRLATKMKELKQKIKVWNRKVFGRLKVNKNLAFQQVEYWDGVESERSLSEGETELKKEAKDSFKKWVLMEEIHWRQLSRELWLKEGDRNTDFFHRMTNAHRRNNSLDRIKINGVWMTEGQEVREGIVNAFQHLLSEEPGWRADIEGLYLNRLNSCEAGVLELPFTEEEIHSALMEMNGDKASGPDGFTVAFWQACWDLRILDASLIANEVIDFWHKRKEKGMICKLDIEKAYDNINWNFLMKVLLKMGFGSRWMEWIWWCISTAKFSVLVNGVPAGFFSNTKGLRQGDPLSPYLFVLDFGGVEMIVSHLLFADDTIIFCEARKEQLTALSWILAWFEASSGLRINLAKSVLIPVGEVEEIEEMTVELGCRVGACPLFT
ncbi:LINE-1 reverse transcriptase-like [Vitis vinifera]|uniref:LINE-1 reverse transcriptase-like n=1 Tax=Vitis vinifera TaxID=29760 RepID=A0A438E4K6_VITVI|nr:LINE-1 reverse transcriptase-like [Vitis vinifera]